MVNSSLSKEQIELIKECKALNIKAGELIEKIESLASSDQRSASICKTRLQEAHVWAIRALINPELF